MGIIYCARNITNGKIYIGKTSKSLEERRSKHESMANCSKYYFHNAIGKHGKESFAWSVIDFSDDESTLSDLERLYIDLFSSSIRECGYNSTHGGDGTSCNDITKQKISIANTGKVRTIEMKSRNSEAQLNRYKNNLPYWYGKNRPDGLMKHISQVRIYEKFCLVCGIYFCSKGSRLSHCNKCNPYPKRSRNGAFHIEE
jgi:group I intron endonuclease